MRFRLRDILPLLLVLAWGVAAFGLLLHALLAPHRDAQLAALSAVAALALSYKVWRPGPKPWGALPLIALTLLPFLFALWWGSPWSPFVALPAVGILWLQPETRAPVLSREAPHALAAVLLCYLALAPALDAVAFGPPEPPGFSVTASGVTLGPTQHQRFQGGGGALWEQRAAQAGLPDLGLVRVTADANENISLALRQSFTPGREGVSFWPIPFGLTIYAPLGTSDALPDGWLRLGVENKSTFVFLMVPIPMSEGQRQLVLLREVGEAVQPSALPPFSVRWRTYAGYHVFQEGNNSAALQRLDGEVLIAGQRLDLPPQAYDDLRVGRLTPALEAAGIAVAVGVAARLRRNRPTAFVPINTKVNYSGDPCEGHGGTDPGAEAHRR